MARTSLEETVLADAAAAAELAAAYIANRARAAVNQHGRFTLALSGGRTPWVMLTKLAAMDLPWTSVHVFQVDERIAPEGDPDRNLTHMQETLLRHAPLPLPNVHPMPVNAEDPAAACADYAATLARICGDPAALDLVHLGLGPDGHTASLVPEDGVLAVTDRDVALTETLYQERRRMTLTYPALNRAREVMFLVDGAGKAPMYARLKAGDPGIPAGRVAAERMMAFVDEAAAN